MATATEVKYTPEDLLKINDRPMPELIDGQLVEREMGQKSDAIAFNLGLLIGIHVKTHDLGLVNGAQGSYQIFPDRPNLVRIPDISFTSKSRLPKDGPADGHSRVAPDLVVEVTSPQDKVKNLSKKVRDFLSAGVPLIWVVYPEALTIQVHRRDGTGQLLQVGDFLDGENILPEFRCEVARVFAGSSH